MVLAALEQRDGLRQGVNETSSIIAKLVQQVQCAMAKHHGMHFKSLRDGLFASRQLLSQSMRKKLDQLNLTASFLRRFTVIRGEELMSALVRELSECGDGGHGEVLTSSSEEHDAVDASVQVAPASADVGEDIIGEMAKLLDTKPYPIQVELARLNSSFADLELAQARGDYSIHRLDAAVAGIVEQCMLDRADCGPDLPMHISSFEESDIVGIFGLAKQPTLKGTIVQLVQFNESKQRWIVQLPDGDKVLLCSQDELTAAMGLSYCQVCKVGDAHSASARCPYCG